MNENANLKKSLGLTIAIALVAGNMMGSGIFMLPATLAQKSGSEQLCSPGSSQVPALYFSTFLCQVGN